MAEESNEQQIGTPVSPETKMAIRGYHQTLDHALGIDVVNSLKPENGQSHEISIVNADELQRGLLSSFHIDQYTELTTSETSKQLYIEKKLESGHKIVLIARSTIEDPSGYWVDKCIFQGPTRTDCIDFCERMPPKAKTLMYPTGLPEQLQENSMETPFVAVKNILDRDNPYLLYFMNIYCLEDLGSLAHEVGHLEVFEEEKDNVQKSKARKVFTSSLTGNPFIIRAVEKIVGMHLNEANTIVQEDEIDASKRGLNNIHECAEVLEINKQTEELFNSNLKVNDEAYREYSKKGLDLSQQIENLPEWLQEKGTQHEINHFKLLEILASQGYAKSGVELIVDGKKCSVKPLGKEVYIIEFTDVDNKEVFTIFWGSRGADLYYQAVPGEKETKTKTAFNLLDPVLREQIKESELDIVLQKEEKLIGILESLVSFR